ncbi:ligand-gated channel [Xanthomonas oryzae pv. oryzicola]|uniref:TonB-dependent receptor n=1 Tax=Xanthomonas oryzae TaxID=347 RepID=UPI000654DE7A|nr:TonB-dependent siderophore receptor [Xanthomonas oryzae]AKN93444.1 ligand-gated channel [Xanthomonas oryzae pv. oryzicola]AKN97174.1 ligand-gated channel [Xanthomonas oryzae pv. oryzicola]AKO12390.1 ligand-gated channel [Xanthomonas oryzae pv. oryzicola]AKO16137.1 ligand-gated channel [Xanthomonas oryzae pv. oryzicola]
MTISKFASSTLPRHGVLLLSISGFCAPAADAQTSEQRTDAEPTTLDTLKVQGQRQRRLESPEAVGSRLGLTQRETPASLQVIDHTDIATQGARTTSEVFDMVAGAMVGNVPGNPAVVTMRGFSGNTISVLHDGVRLGASTIVTRNLDTVGLERVEVLRGPASVLYGEGALGGAINLVSRKPQPEATSMEGMLGIGSFNTWRAGLDVNKPISDTVAVRGFVSRLRSDSLDDIDNNQTDLLTVGGGLLWRPGSGMSMLFSFEHAEDDSTGTYQGSPMVPADVARSPSPVVRSSNGMVVDEATRHVNYNPLGATTGANSDLLRWRVDLPLGNHWSLQNDLSWYQADRDFFYSDNWIYTPATGQLSRSAERIQHDQRFWNERLALAFDGRLGGHRNRFTAGMEHNDTKFHNPRQTGVTTPVSPLDPVLGVFPDGSAANFPGAGNNVIFDSRLRTLAVFAENALNLTARWILLAGARVEKIQLSRDIRDVNTGNVASFRPDYRPFSWRVGTVFDLTPEVQLYGQYATAVSPVSTLLTMRPAAGVFDLSKGKSLEAGIKASAWGKRIEWTAAAYRIERDNILTRDPANPSISVQGGAQSSQGVELSAQAQLTRGLRLDLAAAYGTARYDRLLEAGGADRSGKRPPNVPDGSATLAASYRFLRVPLSLGASSRNVGGFSTDNANTIHVGGHTTFDAWVGYDWQRVSAVLRVRNLSDALYGTYSGYPSTHIYLGAPRSIELTLRTRF